MSTPGSSPRVTRAPRTYGRREQTAPYAGDNPFVDVALADVSPSSANISPTNSVLAEDVPPSSDDLGLGDTSYYDEDDSHGETAQLDVDDEMDDVLVPSRYVRRSLHDDLAMIDQQFENETMDVVATGQPEANSDLLCESADASGPSASEPSSSRHIASPSIPPPHAKSRLVKQTRYVNDSDSEVPTGRVAHISPRTSPSALHPINTPNAQSSPTPPTSQEVSARAKSKGKQRSHSSADEDSDMLPPVSSRNPRGTRKTKERRVKAPSKKELLETQKATARIKADQQAVLPRNERKLKLTSLFEKLSNNMKGRPQIEAVLEDSTAFPSDPIQPFSSSPNRPLPTAFTARPSSLRPQPSRASSNIKDTNGDLVSTGLLGGQQDEAGPSNPEQPRTPSRGGDSIFRSNGLLDNDISAQLDVSDEDDAMPDIRQILQEDRDRRAKADRHKKLLAAKLQYIQKISHAENHADDSDLEVVDDDMHTVAKEEEKDRRLRKARHLDESVGRQKQLTHAGKASLIRSPTKSIAMRGGKHDIQVLVAAAIPSFSAQVQSKTRKGKEREKSKISKNDLDRLLLHESEKQSRELTAQKEAEFYRKVGQRRTELPEVDKAEVLEMMVRKGLESRIRDASSDGDDEDQDDEENDSDWVPSFQRETSADESGDPSEIPDENELPIATDEDYEPTDEAEENDENIPFRVHRTTTRPRAVIDSDSDNDAENQPPVTGQLLVAATSTILGPYPRAEDVLPALSHRGSMSSFDERLEDGTDKENDSRLMFDRGEDKENTAVASQSTSIVVSPLAALRGGSGIFSLQSLVRSDSSSSAGDADTTLLSEERVPLKDIATGDDDDAFFSPSAKASARVRSPRSPIPLPSQSLSPLQLHSSGGKGKGLSTLFNDDAAGERKNTSDEASFSLEPAAVIRSGGLSQFFAASATGSFLASPAPLQLGKPGDGFSQFMTPVKAPGFMGLRKAPTQQLELTLGPSLQPALEVDEKLLHQADEIFEKEQEYVVGNNLSVGRGKEKQELFVNKHGFLTQTKPPSSPTSPAFTNFTSSLARQPLSTIALSRMTEDEDEDEDDAPRPRRLRRRSVTPEKHGGYRSSPSPSPAKPRNAFEILGRKPERIKAPLFENRKRFEKNEFIEGEAEESDEDATFGFGPAKKKDDEDELDGEDQDRVLEELVDDTTMDADTLNEDKVLEKVQEHRALDDAADEKRARDAAEGKMRIKRRNNLLDFDEDDSDEEDWDARRARERMAKKRRIDGDTLEQIEKNPETQAFAAAYRMEDDDEEFAHLDQEETTLVGIDGATTGDFGEENEEGDENEEREVVDAVALRAQLQRVARGEEDVETIDVNNVDWVNADDDDMDDVVHIKEVTATHRQPSVAGGALMDWDVIQQPRRGENSEDIARQQKWARSEGGTRNLGTGRASAVTGMSKSLKSGGGSMTSRRKGPSEGPSASSSQGAKKLGKAPSALSAVSGRRARFGT